jgi:hypothetical protein
MHALSATENQSKQQAVLSTVSNNQTDEKPLHSVMKVSRRVNVASHTENHALDTQTSSASSIRGHDQMKITHRRHHQTNGLCIRNPRKIMCFCHLIHHQHRIESPLRDRQTHVTMSCLFVTSSVVSCRLTMATVFQGTSVFSLASLITTTRVFLRQLRLAYLNWRPTINLVRKSSEHSHYKITAMSYGGYRRSSTRESS